MSGLSPTSLLSVVLGYLAFLFLVASVSEAFASRLIPKEEAEQLVASFQRMQRSLRVTEEEGAGRAPARLVGTPRRAWGVRCATRGRATCGSWRTSSSGR